MRVGKSIFAVLVLASLSSVAMADEWIAERLRGGVMQFEHGNWVVLQRGDIVPDGGKIRTAGDGRVELVRGQERIALAADTEIAVRDAAGQKMTSVIQSRGEVTITAEKRNVQHFSVQTPVLAAVVKGTQFTVTYRGGLARVDVDNGVVQAQDGVHGMVVDVTPGQSATASRDVPLDIAGPGSDRAVFLIEGAPVPAVAREAVLSGALAATDAMEAVKTRAVPNINASVNAGGQGNAVSASVRANNGNGNGNGGAGASADHGNGNGHRNGTGQGGENGNGGAGASVDRGGGNGNGNGNGNGGSDARAAVDPGHGNGNGNANGHDKGLGADVAVSVGNGGGHGLKLGLTL
ncbi:FecR family protein [Devosia sp. XK-2]|uniref:FecR family protein n=1 Tax=Devosia sp. XK-2 TaxID=3126689 RepID=UPI0030D3285F